MSSANRPPRRRRCFTGRGDHPPCAQRIHRGGLRARSAAAAATDRRYGPTRFLSADTARNGQPAAVAADHIALMDALGIKSAVLNGFDWGARTADIVAALRPERCKGLVSVSGYLIGSRASGEVPLPPAAEYRWWVPVLLPHGTRQAGLRQEPQRVQQADLASGLAEMGLRRRDLRPHRRVVRQPDHVDVVTHNYRQGLVQGEAK